MNGVTAEIRTLTGVRAYAAVWVMMLHLPASLGVMPHVVHGAVSGHGGWGVDIFFVLSGFILSLLYAHRFQQGPFTSVYRSYLAARFARIYPLHFVTLAILAAYFVPRALLNGEHNASFSLRQLALHLSLLHGWPHVDHLSWNYPSWSISCEWFAYLLLTPSLVLGLRRFSTFSCIVLAAGLWTILSYALHANGEQIRDTTWPIPRIIAEFTIGYSLYRVHALQKLSLWQADAMVFAGMSAIVVLCFLPPVAEWFLAPAIGALVLGLAREGSLARSIFANRFAVFWGERSYAIYMLHAVVQILDGRLLLALGWAELTPTASWMLLATLVAIVFTAAHIAYGLIEVPARTWLRAQLDGRTVAAGGAMATEPLR